MQITEGFQYIHKCGVFQVDIGLHNVLLDAVGNAKICDFAGSSLDGSQPDIYPDLHAEHPELSTTNPSILSEFFALGSLLYELETAQRPYSEKEDAEVERLFLENQFPNTNRLILGTVITKCWTRGYGDAGQVIADLGLVQDSIGYRSTRR